MPKELKYEPFEKLGIRRPVDRIKFISGFCKGKKILDLGCYDETATVKLETDHWLHGAICREAESVDGLDNSGEIPENGVKFFDNEYMYKGDVFNLHEVIGGERKYDAAVAGELIEHLENTPEFLRYMREKFNGEYLILSTPNGTSLYNHILGLLKRESCHKDHYQVYTYKTLNTLFSRTGFKDWEIIPYHVRFTEMMLKSGLLKRTVLSILQRLVNMYEYIFPLLSGGLIAVIRIR